MKDQKRIELKDFFAKLPDVSFAYLFGSRARGNARPGSDWDVAVWIEGQDDYHRLMRRLTIQDELTQLLGQSVDVVDLGSASPLLRNEVIQARGLLWRRDPLRHAEWEIRAIGEYMDWLPYHRRYTVALLARLTGRDGDGHGQTEAGGDSPWDVGTVHT